MKRTIFRATAAVMAVLAPVTATTLVAPAAQAADAVALLEVKATSVTYQNGAGEDVTYTDYTGATPNQPATKTQWRSIIQDYNRAGYDNVREVWAWSEAMQRNIPLVLIQPLDTEKRTNAPTLYLMNGADGGEGRANWLAQTDVIEFWGGNEGKRPDQKKSRNNPNGPLTSPGIGANIVIPMAGAFSYYTDWNSEVPALQGDGQGPQKWETFMTKELPAAMEGFQQNGATIASDVKAVAGMSMTGTTSLLYAEHNPGMYNAVGSFSGCAETISPMGSTFVNVTLNRGGANIDQMWGGLNTDTARYNDALLNAEKLRGQQNVYVSNGTGLAGRHDLPSSPRVNGNLSASGQVIVEGGIIEGATNACTHNLANRTNQLGINTINYNFRPQGTHQWGYWQDDTRDFWNDLVTGLGTGAVQPDSANDPYHYVNGGSGSSADLPDFAPLSN